ncbi:carbohydrate binding family 9 domain-containing protein [Hymenobacter monticola]|uniref:Carbohydrate binding family 9 domain-containing protein n=1 Tax=Hymenobacter monticola TaxID=1705399 RepID=A0ABY4B4N0_9BACT|nr:carbohydrate binding family 9 domain-containing protein [Hymenobacter monticola]UOE34088.1 carbohydrate binding family 9 domain-containing protein [Hymenobacter monticola]
MLCAGLVQGQDNQGPPVPNAATPAPKRQLQAVRISTPPKLDGVLDEAVWQAAPIATKFYELEPTPGRLEKHPTEVRVLYDDNAIYVGAIMHDAAQDSILRELSNRDNIGNSDWFGVFFDTYNDHLNGYEFIVTSGGVQVDLRQSPANGEDGSWNAVWDSRTALHGTD